MKWHPELLSHLEKAGWEVISHDDTHITTSTGNTYELLPDGKVKVTSEIDPYSATEDQLEDQLIRLGIYTESDSQDPYLGKYIFKNF